MKKPCRILSAITTLAIALLPVATSTATTTRHTSTIHPILDATSGLLIGGVSRGKWVTAAAIQKRVAARAYTVYGMSGKTGTSQGAKAADGEAPCDQMYYVDLKPNPALTDSIATDESWNVAPRPVTSLPLDNDTYEAIASNFLAANGLTKAKPSIKQLLKVDLDGTGTDSVIIVGDSYGGNPPVSCAYGDYAFILLRTIKNGVVNTIPLAQELHRSPEVCPLQYRVKGCLDLNGDGKLDIVLTSAYYEGSSTDVFDLTMRGDMMAIGEGCGV